jgi:hypothetical protein
MITIPVLPRGIDIEIHDYEFHPDELPEEEQFVKSEMVKQIEEDDSAFPWSNNQYNKFNGSRCPYCGDFQIVATGPNVDEDELFSLEFECHNCDRSFIQLFESTGYEGLDAPFDHKDFHPINEPEEEVDESNESDAGNDDATEDSLNAPDPKYIEHMKEVMSE